MKKLLPAALLISAFVATAPSYAATSTISKTITPANVFIFSNGSGGTSAEYFNLTGSDFPGNQLSAPKTLTSIDFAAASYIGATSDAAQICYYLPYTTQPAACHDITPGTSMAGYTLFNNFQFGNGAQVAIRHNVIGTPGASLRPSGTENVTFHYSY